VKVSILEINYNTENCDATKEIMIQYFILLLFPDFALILIYLILRCLDVVQDVESS